VLASFSALALSAVAIGASSSPVPASGVDSSCWTLEPGAIGTVDHPTEPDAIVLQMTVGGGFVPVEYAFMENPTFTLYGNKVAIFRSSPATSDSIYDALAPFACVLLSPDEVDELLTQALDDIGLRDSADSYPNPNITDVPSTTFTIDADGVSRSDVVHGLGFDEQAPDPDARAAFQTLAGELADFGTQVDGVQLYDAPRYRSMLTDAWPELEGTPVAWPWDDVSPADYGKDGSSTVVLTSEQVAQVASVPSGGQTYILLEAPDGERLSLTISPELPPIG
jgi:hypothetical protein